MPRSKYLPAPRLAIAAALLAVPGLCGAAPQLAFSLQDLATRASTPCQVESPVYPPALRAAGVAGQVQLELVLGADGGVESATVRQSSGEAALDAAALASLSRARCQPFHDPATGNAIRGTALARLDYRDPDGGAGQPPGRPQAEPLAMTNEQRAAAPPQAFPPDFEEALNVLVRAYDVGPVVASGMDKAFAKLPDKLGPVPKARYVECTRARLSEPVLEQVVRPGFAMVVTDPGLMIRLARLLGSPLGRKAKAAALQGKSVEAAGITGADALEANSLLESPDLKAFLEQGGLKRINDAIAPYLYVASRQATEACLKELVPPGYKAKIELPA